MGTGTTRCLEEASGAGVDSGVSIGRAGDGCGGGLVIDGIAGIAGVGGSSRLVKTSGAVSNQL